jgi:diguanylate cyclase (GGDEF)-like protein/PAS domain S-box-containing protein
MKSKEPEQKKPSGLRKRAEEKLKSRITTPRAVSDKETQQLIHELQVHQIELEMQNDELRKAQAELEESRAKYSDLYDFAPTGYFTFDKHGLITEANLTAAKELGLERSLLINKPFRTHIVTEDRNIFDQHLQKVLKSGDRQTCEIRLKRKAGLEFYAQLESIPANDLKGNTLCKTSVSDITVRKRADEAIRESEERYHSLVDSAEDSIYLVDRNYKYLSINKKHLARLGLSGLSGGECLGCAYSKFHSLEDTKWFTKKAGKVFSRGESIICEYKSLSDGRSFLLTLSPVKKPDGTITAVTVISKDITELKSMEEKLRALALTDKLTGLYNRRGFFALVEQLFKLANRQKTVMFMLYADMDNLKEINDTLGHKEGDLAISDIASILKKSYRDSDLIARIGGDEFVVISAVTTGYNPGEITARLQKSIQVHNAKANRSYKLSLSIGIAYYEPENPCSIEELLAQGDKLMYEQKKNKQKA